MGGDATSTFDMNGKTFLGSFLILFCFSLVSATWTLRVVVPKEMAQDHVGQDRQT